MATFACSCGAFSVGNVQSAKGKCPRCGGELTKRSDP